MSDRPDLDAMEAFVRVAEQGSITRAAALLRVPRATLGRRIERLEDQLGVRLLRRSTRRVALTDAGKVFQAHAVRALAAADAARDAVLRSTDTIRGELRVAAPPLQDPSFHDAICAFAVQHPEVRLLVRSGTEHVDLVGSGYDVAVRAGTAIAEGLVMRRLHRDQQLVVAAPSYLRAHGTPSDPLALAGLDCVVGFDRGDVPASHWPLRAGGKVAVYARFTSNDLSLLVAAAVAGLGLALLPRSAIEPQLDSGALVCVLEDEVGAENTVAVVYPEREHLPPAVRAFVDAVGAWAAASSEGTGRWLPLASRPVAERTHST